MEKKNINEVIANLSVEQLAGMAIVEVQIISKS